MLTRMTRILIFRTQFNFISLLSSTFPVVDDHILSERVVQVDIILFIGCMAVWAGFGFRVFDRVFSGFEEVETMSVNSFGSFDGEICVD
jgi:hypothetical protein